MSHADYGTGDKKLGVYVKGLIACSILTLISFWAVMMGDLTKLQTFIVIYASACAQFLVQLVCFLRLNTQTEQGKNNVMALIFTAVILVSIIVGSLWIMWNLDFYMVH
ncbi:MAG: cytochrome o ubiquinol oxidase subunit IV [Gammaproteobacteria bacterium]